jgi:hypothetical protein
MRRQAGFGEQGLLCELVFGDGDVMSGGEAEADLRRLSI